MEENWKTIKDFEKYEVSNYGRVKSFNFNKEKILKNGINSNGYYVIDLCNNKKHKTFNVHQLVAIAFLKHEPNRHKLVVNHKDFNRLNNHIDNLEIVTQRENTNLKHIKSTSKYVGVCWDKNKNKWISAIRINGKLKHLGTFTNELDAHNAYQNKLKEILKESVNLL